MRYTTYIWKLATSQGEKQQQQAGCCLPHRPRGLLLLFPHAELDVVVTPEGGGGAGEAARRSSEAASTKEGRWDEEREREGEGGGVDNEAEEGATAAHCFLSLFSSVLFLRLQPLQERRRLIERGGKEEGRGRATFLTRKFESYDVAKAAKAAKAAINVGSPPHFYCQNYGGQIINTTQLNLHIKVRVRLTPGSSPRPSQGLPAASPPSARVSASEGGSPSSAPGSAA